MYAALLSALWVALPLLFLGACAHYRRSAIISRAAVGLAILAVLCLGVVPAYAGNHCPLALQAVVAPQVAAYVAAPAPIVLQYQAPQAVILPQQAAYAAALAVDYGNAQALNLRFRPQPRLGSRLQALGEARQNRKAQNLKIKLPPAQAIVVGGGY